MFSHEGTARSDRQNRVLAGYLSFVGGFANAYGFVVIGEFTSHVTGRVGRGSIEVAGAEWAAALSTLSFAVAFFGGAFVVSALLESRALGHVSRGYASALTVETTCLLATAYLWSGARTPTASVLGGLALCVAMGVQNGLVTRLSGAIVRTTHLTGVVTDLGIEAARWFRFARHAVARRTRLPLVLGPNEPERPPRAKVLLLATIAGSFFVGATVGAVTTRHLGACAILFPAGAIALAAGYAVVNGRTHADVRRE